MKVLHIITGLKNAGAEAILYRVVTDNTYFIEHEVVCLTGEGFYSSILRANGIKVTILNIGSFITLILGVVKLFNLIKSTKPDIVQTWMYHGDIIGGVVAKLAGINRIFWGIHSTFLKPNETKFLTKFAVKVSIWLSYFIPYKIICCSETALNSHKELGYCTDKMIVINNGFDTDKFVPNINKRNRTRELLKIDEDVFVIGMIARWHPVKDHKTLLNALCLIKPNVDKWKCILVGDGMLNSNDELYSLIKLNGLENLIICLGPQQDITDNLNVIDVHVLSSGSESFGNVTAEAMSCAVPCIMTDVGESQKLLNDIGWIVPPRNFVKLSDAILSAYTEFKNLQKWDLLKNSCRERIIANYSMDKMINSYNSAWKIVK